VFADLDAMIGRVLAAVERGDPPEARALRFLLREYRDGERGDLADPLGAALAAALDCYADDAATVARAEWLRLFTEAAAISDDARVSDSARSLIADLAAEWPTLIAVGDASTSIDACLAALPLADAERIVPLAVDHIERVVGGAYRPGLGVVHALGDRSQARGSLADQVLAASALLTAFEITGRLPYSMLAEELMLLSRGDVEANADVAVGCGAIAVWCRLAALHDDAAYRGAAVIAESADYDADACRMLERIAARVNTTSDAAVYGIAIGEWRARAHARGETP
jgi:hypothetical protein